MKEVKKKYVYELNPLDNYHGMIRFDIYITLVFFNYDKNEDSKKVLIDLNSLIEFLTECIVEIFTSNMSINLNDVNPFASNFYISGFYDVVSKQVYKTLLFNFGKKDIFISESSYGDGTSLRMKDIKKEDMLLTVIGAHKFAISLVQEVIDRCNSSKSFSVVMDDKDGKVQVKEVEKDSNNKFDMNNCGQVGW